MLVLYKSVVLKCNSSCDKKEKLIIVKKNSQTDSEG